MSPPGPGWSVRWLTAAAGEPPPDADRALADHLLDVLGPGPVVLGRLCPVCGSDRHGRPYARHDGSRVAISLSRSGSHLVTAIRTDGGAMIGVDVERIGEVTRRVRYADLVHPDDAHLLEPVAGADRTAYLWVAKEAALKAEGVGLTRPMPQVRLADHDLQVVEAPEGCLAVVCLGRRQGSGGSGRE